MTKERNKILKEKAILLREEHPDATRAQFAELMRESTVSNERPEGIKTALRIAMDAGFNGKFKNTGRPFIKVKK